MLKLNIGAGFDKVKGFKSIDIRKETRPDYVVNLEQNNCLKEIKDNSVEFVLMKHVFEHIKNIQGLMKEVYRVCTNNATVFIVCPYWSHRTSVEDPTHVRYMAEDSMMYFDKSATGSDGKHFQSDYNFKVEKIFLNVDSSYKDEPQEKILEDVKRYLNVVCEIHYTLKVKK